jgi:murein DD-endopeptidase MepM/ murein hydrolase activator NlpD
MSVFRFFVFLMLIVSLFSGCRTARKTTAPRSTTAKTHTVQKPNNPAGAGAKTPAYPAVKYYGNDWNTEHVRVSSSLPSESVTLLLGGKFVMPVCGKVNSEFGPRNGSMHTGIDLKIALNDPVYCAFDGMVRMAKEYGAYGNVVVVRHENGLETLYGHLSAISVKVNQQVKAGARLGSGGKTGRATGVHLHFETRFKGEPFNPRLAIDFENCRIKSSTLALNKDSYKEIR